MVHPTLGAQQLNLQKSSSKKREATLICTQLWNSVMSHFVVHFVVTTQVDDQQHSLQEVEFSFIPSKMNMEKTLPLYILATIHRAVYFDIYLPQKIFRAVSKKIALSSVAFRHEKLDFCLAFQIITLFNSESSKEKCVSFWRKKTHSNGMDVPNRHNIYLIIVS